MAKKKDEPSRKIGERTETIDVKLTQLQIEDERVRVLDLLQAKDELEEAWKAKKESHKAELTDIDAQIAAARASSRSGRVRREIVIEEWVTKQNEVIKIDKATGLEIGRRTATRDELQESLPLDKPAAKQPAKGEDDGEEELASEVAGDSKGEGDAGEFGEAE